MKLPFLIFYIGMSIIFFSFLLYTLLFNFYAHKAQKETGIPLSFAIKAFLSMAAVFPLIGIILSVFFLLLFIASGA